MAQSQVPRVPVLFLALLVMAAPAWAGGVAILETSLVDNGDNDGFADSEETVTLFLTVKNTSGADLENVTATLYALDPNVACLSKPQITIGDLFAGETLTTTDGFEFTLSDIDRTTLGLGPFDDLSAEFRISFQSDSGPVRGFSHKVILDLDLDISGGSGAASYLENFESQTLGTFEIQNLDNGLATLGASDGYRCQYNDPDNPNGNGPGRAECFLGPNAGHASATWWGMSGPTFSPLGGRGFSGFHSAFYGVDLGDPKNWTTPLSVVEGIGMIQPVHIARDAANPELIFRHQNSLADGRDFSLPQDQTYDRGVVMVQVADDQGNPAGPWFKVDPHQNHYDQQNAPVVINCGFDPIDDGNTEDDFFAPTDPNRKTGPSSTCYPEYIFANMGETSEPWDPANIGRADGPGLQGLWGIGTWIETRVDLSRFRGRSIRVRFVATALEQSSNPADTWEDLFFGMNPVSGDDGWWLDDIEITGLVANPATVVADDKDNSALPGVAGADTDFDGFVDTCDNCPSIANANQWDGDLDTLGDSCDICPFSEENVDPDADAICGSLDNCPDVPNPMQTDTDNDGFGAACDCNDLEFTVNPNANETNDGADQNCNGAFDELTSTVTFAPNKTTMDWGPQTNAIRYQVGFGTTSQFTVGCTTSTVFTNTFNAGSTPPPGGVQYFVVRPFGPNIGDWGINSGGVRTLPCAP